MFFKDYKYIFKEKKLPECIIKDIEISSDESDKEDSDEENSSKANSGEENHDVF